MAPHSDAALDEALELLHFAFRKITEEPDRLLAARGLSRVHHRILFFVRRNAGLSVGELLEVLGVTKQALHRPMHDLLERGLLDASRSPQSRRTKVLTLTRAGAALEAKLSGLQRAAFASAFRGLSTAGRSAWHDVMFELGGRRKQGDARA